MAKASITCKCPECGAEYTWMKTCYNRREADSWEAWAAGQSDRLCPECYRKAQREAATKAGAEQARKDRLPALTGSEKQIAWAEAIRGKAIATWDRCDIKTEARPLLIECISGHLEAKWWIDNRSNLECATENNPLAKELMAKINKVEG